MNDVYYATPTGDGVGLVILPPASADCVGRRITIYNLATVSDRNVRAAPYENILETDGVYSTVAVLGSAATTPTSHILPILAPASKYTYMLVSYDPSPTVGSRWVCF